MDNTFGYELKNVGSIPAGGAKKRILTATFKFNLKLKKNVSWLINVLVAEKSGIRLQNEFIGWQNSSSTPPISLGVYYEQW